MTVFIIAICVFIFVLLLMFIQSYRYAITRVTLPIKDLPSAFDGLKVLFVSDIHRRLLSEKIISSLQKESFDYVFIGGDLVEKNVPLERTETNIQLLTSIAETFFVWGNHDLKVSKGVLTALLKKFDVTILENEAYVLKEHSNQRLWLIGVGDVCTKQDDLERAIIPTQQFDVQNDIRILLSHVPTITKKIKQEHQIALVLSGHTHGGQIALPWLGPITGAVGEWFPKQVQGLYHLDDTLLYISSGYGTSHYPLRLFTTPEIVILTFNKKMP